MHGGDGRKTVIVRLEPELHRQLKVTAAATGISMNALVTESLRLTLPSQFTRLNG